MGYAHLYLDNPDMDRASLITLTNVIVKRLIENYTPFYPLIGSLKSDNGGSGKIALYTVQFMGGAGVRTKSIFVGQAADGRTLSEDECRRIIESAGEVKYSHGENQRDGAEFAALFEKILPTLEADAAAALSEGVAAEVKQIKCRTATALQRLENEIRAAESEITKSKGTGAELSNNAFAGNQKAHGAANHLNELKQNEFIEKMKLKKQEADDIAALTAKAKLHTYKTCLFAVEYTAHGGNYGA